MFCDDIFGESPAGVRKMVSCFLGHIVRGFMFLILDLACVDSKVREIRH